MKHFLQDVDVIPMCHILINLIINFSSYCYKICTVVTLLRENMSVDIRCTQDICDIYLDVAQL